MMSLSESSTTGNKRVLVVRVISDSYWPSQDEAKMYDDVFVDHNNLVSTITATIDSNVPWSVKMLYTNRSLLISYFHQQRVRYEDCSNGALIFKPATGTNVNKGVLTVTTSNNLRGMTWRDCGTIATNGANVLGISRDFTMIVCPDVVNFEGAAAWGNMPGSVSWYKSQYASLPIVQVCWPSSEYVLYSDCLTMTLTPTLQLSNNRCMKLAIILATITVERVEWYMLILLVTWGTRVLGLT